MTLQELEPYLSATSAVLGVATLAFLTTLVREVRENARDRIAAQNDRMLGIKEDLERTEKWHAKEKAELQGRLDGLKDKLESLLKVKGLDFPELARGARLSDSDHDDPRAAVQRLVADLRDQLQAYKRLDGDGDRSAAGTWHLAAAKGALAAGAVADAASELRAATGASHVPWDAYFALAVGYANERGGKDSDLASLRAYNEAIALAPDAVGPSGRARLFTYRAGVLKRLGRLTESEADARIALSLATSRHEVEDAHYTLACVHALRREREAMLAEVAALSSGSRYIGAIQDHRADYFAAYSEDPELLSLLRARS